MKVPLQIPMRHPCRRCGNSSGYYITKNSQDVVYCSSCDAWAGYNVPKHESGKAPATLKTARDVKSSKRFNVIERAHGRCELCGRKETDALGLTAAHIVSVKDGESLLTKDQLNSEENLIALCHECNSGQSDRVLPLWLAVAILRARTK